VDEANREQRTYWNEQAGAVWVANQARLDEQIRPHGELALAALAPSPGERVLDLGCGCGETTLSLAKRVGSQGFVLGVDLSEPMLARARERATAAGLGVLEFVAADAQTAVLGEARFDAAFSRFGVMFFAEPEAAFANVRRALVPNGRLAFVCWRPAAENEWVRVPMQAAAPFFPSPPAPPPPDAPGPFSFGDAGRVRRVLEAAGFDAIGIEPVDLVMAPGGGSLDEAAELVLDVGPLAHALREMGAGPELRARVRDAVRKAYEPHLRAGRVELGSAVWVVSAQKAAPRDNARGSQASRA
jgi:SAM-dependent methyltransferase